MSITDKRVPAATSVVPATPTQRVRKHYVALDGLRGVAVLAVLCFHFGAAFSTGGYLGVDVFFVISGFVVATNLLDLSTTRGWARQFYGRRFSRLYPVLATSLAVVGATWAAGLGGLAADWRSILGASAMSMNLTTGHLGGEPHGIVHLWSLGVEWHFYLVAPFLILAGRRVLGDRQRSVALALGAVAIALLRLALLGAHSIDPFAIYLHTLTRLDGLLLGTAIALGVVSPKRLPMPWLTPTAFGLLLALIIIGPAWGARSTLTLGFVVPTAIAATAVLVINEANDRTPGWLNQLLTSRVLVWAGSRSYSLYVWHYIIGVALIAGGSEAFQGWPRFGLQVVASLVAGEASYRLVERPARFAINRRL